MDKSKSCLSFIKSASIGFKLIILACTFYSALLINPCIAKILREQPKPAQETYIIEDESALIAHAKEKIAAGDCQAAWNILWPMVGNGNYNAAYLLAIFDYVDILHPPLFVIKHDNKYIDHFITMLFLAKNSNYYSQNEFGQYINEIDDIILRYGLKSKYHDIMPCPHKCDEFMRDNLYLPIISCAHTWAIQGEFFGHGLSFLFKKSCAEYYSKNNEIIDIYKYFEIFNTNFRKNKSVKYASCGNKSSLIK